MEKIKREVEILDSILPEKFSVQGLINKELYKKDEPKEINHWRSSGLGSCLTGRYLERLGIKPDTEFDDRTLRVFSAGRFVEDWIIGLIQKSGVEYDTQGRIEIPEQNLVGHYDLRIKPDNYPIIYEIKSKHSRSFWYMLNRGEGPHLHHLMQLWSYLFGSNTPEGRLLYVSKDDLSLLEYPVFLDNEGLKELVFGELDILNTAWGKKLPPKPSEDPKAWQNKLCRFHKQCMSQSKYL